MFKKSFMLLSVIVSVFLMSCADTSKELSEQLPLDEERPTFVVFYTDN